MSENRNNILHVRVVCGSGGGPEKTIINSPRYLIPWGYNCLCAYMHPPKDAGFDVLRQRAKEAQAPIVEIEDRGAMDFSVVRQLIKICRENNINIWHGHDYKSNAIGLLASRFHKLKLVTTVHGWVHHTSRTPLYYAIDKFCLKRYDKVICVSNDLYDQCQKLGVKTSRLVLIENAIDIQQFKPVKRSEDGLIKIGAVGRLEEEKGFAPLIETVAELSKKHPEIRLTIFGEGTLRSELESLIARLGVKDIVSLPGFEQNLINLYSSLDIFVLNSLREGLPNVCLEAMAMGVPMVASAVAGVPKLVENGVNGLVFPVADKDALQTALTSLIESPQLRQQLAHNARTTVEQRFSFDKRMEKMRALYDSLDL